MTAGVGARGAALAILLGVSAATSAAAESEVGSDREDFIQELFLGETPYSQEQGELQVILTGSHSAGEEADISEGSVTLEYGLSDRFQIEVDIPYLGRDPNDAGDDDEEGGGEGSQGIGDVEAGVLYALVNEDRLVVSAALDVSFPTGDEDEELGEGRFVWEPALHAGVAIGESWLFASLGAEVAEDGETGLTYGAAFAHRLGLGLSGVVEVNGATGAGEEVAFLVPGAVWRAPAGVEIQLGVPVGLTNQAADWGLVGKIVAEF